MVRNFPSQSLQEVREQERMRISRELHDELGQQLTGLKLDLLWLSQRIQGGKPVALERVTEMRDRVDDTVQSVRRISAELRPLILDDLGFVAGLKWLADDFARRTGLDIRLDLRLQEHRIPPLQATALFRIVQEALTNVVKHARARHVDIRLVESEDRVEMSIIDDGVGLSEENAGQGIGLLGMRERALALGGSCELGNSLDRGSAVRVSVPLSPSVMASLEGGQWT